MVEARSARKEGLGFRAAILFFLAVFFRVMHDGLSERGTTRSLPKPGSLNYALLLQRKNMMAYVRSVDNALSTFEIRVTSCRNVLEPEQIEALESRFASRAANRLWKDLNLASVLFGKAFRLQPDCERVRTASSKNNSVNMNSLSFAFLPSI